VFNADRTIHEGVELGFQTDLLQGLWVDQGGSEYDALTLTGVYNWSNFHFDDDAQFGNARLPGVPEHAACFMLAYRHPAGFSVGPTLQTVSRYNTIFDNIGGVLF